MKSPAVAIVLAAGLTARAVAMSGYPQLAVPLTAPPLDPGQPGASWQHAASLQLGWNLNDRRPGSEPTKAFVATDGSSLYVRFDAVQREPIAAAQRSDNVGEGSDDAVRVDLWPGGPSGYAYTFEATPNGTHYQTSTENTAYTPHWESQATNGGGAYTVTMKIPLNVMRGIVPGHPWKAQFVRYVHATGELQVWSYDPAQSSPDDVSRAGTLTLPQIHATFERPKPRLATYLLGEAASKTIGGSTSRTGADLSVPITPTASFYSTFHPDYSNVEADQQTIAPTVYARYYNEVRPFFTQGSNAYDNFNCDACPGIVELYTPAIPTPREGYAVEGKQGNVTFGTFDALGDNGRNDLASALTYRSDDRTLSISAQRVAVNEPGLNDVVDTTGIAWTDHRYLSAYFNYGSDSGTNVLAGNQAQRYDVGAGWANQSFALYASARKLGEYYNPVDGYVQHPGIAGYSVYSAKLWTFGSNGPLAAAGISGFLDRYQGPTQGQAQSDTSLQFDLTTKSGWDFQAFTGSNYWRFNDPVTGTGPLEPVSQNGGFQITYHAGALKSDPSNFPSHGSAPYPTSLTYNTGRYGDGRLDTWFRTSTIRMGMKGALTLMLDDTDQRFPNGSPNVQWFESASYSYQIDRNSAFALGVRREIGTPPIPNGGGNCIGSCSNVTLAYHLLLRHSEFYLAYGDPNALTTVPQAIFKVIFYAGAEKGT